MPRCGFFWLISYDGFCDDSQNPNNNVSCLVWRLQRGCSGVHGCLVPFDILNASRCIISSCWWFHPWFRCGVLWLWLILNMLRHGFHSRANDGFWGELQNCGVGCLVMLDDGSWVNRETLTVGLELTDLGWFHPTTCRALCGAFNVDVAVCLKAWSPFDILNASRCIVSSCWWFHPWFRCGVLWLWLILNMLRHGFHSRANDGFWGELQNRGGGAGIDGFGVISPNNVLWLVWHLQRGCSRVLESLVPFDILNASRCIVSSCWWFHPWSHDGIRVPRKLPAHTRWLLRLYLEWLKVGSVAWLPHFEHVRMLLFRWGGQATTLFVFSVPNKYLNYGYLVMPSEADMAPFDVSICLHAFAIAGCGSLHGVGSSRREGLLAGMMVDFDTMHAFHFRFAFVHSYCDNACTMSLVIDGCYLVDPASSHMLVSKIKPCMSRSWTLGWVDRSASGVHRLPRPFCRRCAPGLNWPGRASGAVTLKKLECSKQAYALDTLAWDNTTGF
ncbi:hypothetical protein VNO77_45511 [Canavalia gladiata]|uniref:Uncharacterized protein n=1 Tax=Canavalia gladiata TaxID=3824 RepID=A0AAN9JJR7_CANGL